MIYVEYLVLVAFLVLLEWTYLKTATSFGMVDISNERSSHKGLNVRGGGAVIVVAALLYFVQDLPSAKFATIGLIVVSITGFVDDIRHVPALIRLVIQLGAVMLLLYDMNILVHQGLIIGLSVAIILTGAINATNFMDGINGITAIYGFVMVLTMVFLNRTHNFVDTKLLVYTLVGILVFGFYNVRPQAQCFAGDVGSAGLGYLLVFFTLSLVVSTGNFSFILLWAVYGVDSVITILHRLIRKQNIFTAHRTHLYQYLANEKGLGHLLVAFLYGAIQVLINLLLVIFLIHTQMEPWAVTITVLLMLGIVYIFTKIWILRSLELY